ncbi:hypothetical protein [Halomonas marinisediminis]|uniref:DUF3311 domain-containing protein n=1 Tax=Halomonas marinisediminis TaxID=2546095 RepID=A0ABY2DBK1_9GAMM|nr:hypothetical protein [Halomonas marinisediminis]TDB05674.1 hypothetical protein E0702_01545 [Halomonas marinisediminis]
MLSVPRRRERLLALIILAALLFTPPLVLVPDRAMTISWLPLYLFIAWGFIIALAAWLMESPSPRKPPGE